MALRETMREAFAFLISLTHSSRSVSVASNKQFIRHQMECEDTWAIRTDIDDERTLGTENFKTVVIPEFNAGRDDNFQINEFKVALIQPPIFSA